MEFMTGVKEKETLELSELLKEGRLGEEVKVNGAVHQFVTWDSRLRDSEKTGRSGPVCIRRRRYKI